MNDANPFDVSCPYCEAAAGSPCLLDLGGGPEPVNVPHRIRRHKAEGLCRRCDNTGVIHYGDSHTGVTYQCEEFGPCVRP